MYVSYLLLTQGILALGIKFAQTIATWSTELYKVSLKVSSCYSKPKDTIKTLVWIWRLFHLWECVTVGSLVVYSLFFFSTAGALVVYPVNQIYFLNCFLSFFTLMIKWLEWLQNYRSRRLMSHNLGWVFWSRSQKWFCIM